MLPLPSLGPPRGAALLFGAHTEGQVNAGSMPVPCNIFDQDGFKSAQDAFKTVQEPFKSGQDALKTLQEPFKRPKMQSRAILSFCVDFKLQEYAPGPQKS